MLDKNDLYTLNEAIDKTMRKTLGRLFRIHMLPRVKHDKKFYKEMIQRLKFFEKGYKYAH